VTALTLENVKKSYGAHAVIHGVDLHIEAGEFVVFVGPSGCGKSTLLRMIAGLEDITSGLAKFDQTIVNTLTPSERGIAMVFQSYALYPHMTVRANIGFGLKLAGVPRREAAGRVEEVAEILRLSPYLDRLPKQLSGGQRQRVAIGRAMVRDPKVFLFDEPLSNLDASLRVATRLEIARLHKRMPNTTMIYVTHDQVEAMTLADRIVVLNAGRIEQQGAPMEIYARPANLFVARFIGSPAMNILPCELDADGYVKLASGRVARGVRYRASGKARLGVRPEDLVFTETEALIEGRVDLVEHLGEAQVVYVDVGGAEPLIAKAPRTAVLSAGARVGLTADPAHFHLFDAKGESLASVAMPDLNAPGFRSSAAAH
jgi:alpha-glucoside transport system ATP-binding protein